MAQKGRNYNSILVKGTPDYPLIVITLILLLFGLIMLLSASTPSSLAESGDSYSIFKKQAAFAIVGVVIATGVFSSPNNALKILINTSININKIVFDIIFFFKLFLSIINLVNNLFYGFSMCNKLKK